MASAPDVGPERAPSTSRGSSRSSVETVDPRAADGGFAHDGDRGPGRYVRHDLVRVDPEAWSAQLAARPDLLSPPVVAAWAEAGRPLVVRRFVPGEPRDRVPLGLPLPPTEGKRRIGLAVPDCELAPYPAPTLAEVGPFAPFAWRATLDALLDLGQRFGLAPRPFGSLLWQAVTGSTYLTASSDLDVLWLLPTPLVSPGLLGELGTIAAAAPMRLDGEILLPDGAGMHWRELFEAPPDGSVLTKHVDRLELRPVAGLLAEADA